MSFNLAYTPTPIATATTRNKFSFNPHETLPSRANRLWKIEHGVVKITTCSEDGDLIVLGLWGKGEVVGKIFGKVNPYDLICLTRVQATLIPVEDSLKLTDVLSSYIEQLEQLTVIRSYKKTDIMLLKLLSWLGKKFGQETDKGNLIDLRLTHQDLADILGATRVTITRLLNQLEQQGFIERLSLQRIILKEDDFWHYEI